MADFANRAWLTRHSFLDSTKAGKGRQQLGPGIVANLQPLRRLAAQERGRQEEQRSPRLVTHAPRPPDESAPVQRATQISPALAGLLPSAPPPFPPGLVAAFVAADSSTAPGQSSWIVVKPTLRGMRPISRLPRPQLSSLIGRRPRRNRYPRPRWFPGGSRGESANADAVPAGPHAGGGGVWCARRGGGGGGAPPPPPLRGRVSLCRRRRLAPLRCRAGWGRGSRSTRAV